MAVPTLLGTSSNGGGGGSGASLTVSHTVPASTDVLLVCVVTFGNTRVTSVTWNGTALARLGRPEFPGTVQTWHMEWWYLLTPTPATGNVVFTPAGSDFLALGAFNVSGGIHASLNILEGGSSTGPSLAMPSTADCLVIDVVGSDVNAQTFTVGAGQTKIFGQDSVANSNVHIAASSRAGQSPTRSMSWTLGSSDNWGQSAIAIHAITGSGGGGSTTVPRLVNGGLTQ